MQDNKYHHGNLREALLDTAVQILSQPVEGEISLRILAGKLGVSRSAPYRHFKNKSALMSAVAAKGFSQMRNTFRDDMEFDDPENAIRKIMEDYVQFATDNPRLYRLMFSGSVLESPFSGELCGEAQMTFERLSGILRKLKLGVKTTSEANVAAWATVHGISLLIIEKLLSVSSTGDISHSLISTGRPLSKEETKSQICSAARIITSGIAASSTG